jgi:magnesium-transporting ATPase (P-type)
VIQKILPRDENQRNFEKESKNDTETKLISEYIFAIIIFSISFYSIYSNWGENSITDPNPTLSSYYQEELSKKELSKLTKTQKIDYRQKRLNDINEYIEIKAKWDKKYENEDISSFYFFSLGYVLPLIIGVVIFVCLSLFLLCIFFGAYLVFWPLGYSFIRLQSRRDLYKILENKFIYPIVAIIFIISIFLTFVYIKK